MQQGGEKFLVSFWSKRMDSKMCHLTKVTINFIVKLSKLSNIIVKREFKKDIDMTGSENTVT